MPTNARASKAVLMLVTCMYAMPCLEETTRDHKMPICRDFYGSDGTRTRDLRRDRPAFIDFIRICGCGGSLPVDLAGDFVASHRAAWRRVSRSPDSPARIGHKSGSCARIERNRPESTVI
jgi:hypothetical protein